MQKFAFNILITVVSITMLAYEAKAAITNDINKFSYRFAKILDLNDNENIFYSPLSISMATGMLAYGASGQTLNEICSAFKQTDCQSSNSEFHKVHKQLLAEYSKQAANKSDDKGSKKSEENDKKNFHLNINNYAVVAEHFNVKQNYVDNLSNTYNSSVIKVNFSKKIIDNESSVEAKTLKIINELFGKVDPKTSMYLLNTVHFNSLWTNEFDSESKIDFYNQKDLSNPIRVVSLNNKNAYRYKNFTEKKFTIIDLPYVNEKSLLLLIPNEKNGLKQLKETMFSEESDLDNLLKELEMTEMQLRMPKFAYKIELNLKTLFQQLGIKKVFDDQAELNGISDEPIKVTEAVHQAFINVTQRGTEAGASTGFKIQPRSMFHGVTVTVDHPFAYIIRDNQNGLNLFIGFLVDLQAAPKK